MRLRLLVGVFVVLMLVGIVVGEETVAGNEEPYDVYPESQVYNLNIGTSELGEGSIRLFDLNVKDRGYESVSFQGAGKYIAGDGLYVVAGVLGAEPIDTPEGSIKTKIYVENVFIDKLVNGVIVGKGYSEKYEGDKQDVPLIVFYKRENGVDKPVEIRPAVGSSFGISWNILKTSGEGSAGIYFQGDNFVYVGREEVNVESNGIDMVLLGLLDGKVFGYGVLTVSGDKATQTFVPESRIGLPDTAVYEEGYVKAESGVEQKPVEIEYTSGAKTKLVLRGGMFPKGVCVKKSCADSGSVFVTEDGFRIPMEGPFKSVVVAGAVKDGVVDPAYAGDFVFDEGQLVLKKDLELERMDVADNLPLRMLDSPGTQIGVDFKLGDENEQRIYALIEQEIERGKQEIGAGVLTVKPSEDEEEGWLSFIDMKIRDLSNQIVKVFVKDTNGGETKKIVVKGGEKGIEANKEDGGNKVRVSWNARETYIGRDQF